MPEPNRPPWLLGRGLDNVLVARLIEQRSAVALSCHACRRRARWDALELRRRFSRHVGLTVRKLAPRLRCGACRSEWIEIGLDPEATPPAAHE